MSTSVAATFAPIVLARTLEMPRKPTRKLISDAADIDEKCFRVVNDVRAAGFANRSVNPKMSRLQEQLSPNSSH